jgi:hypothetical protein
MCENLDLPFLLFYYIFVKVFFLFINPFSFLLVFLLHFLLFRFDFLSPLISPVIFAFILSLFFSSCDLSPTYPTCLGLKGLVVIVVVFTYYLME